MQNELYYDGITDLNWENDSQWLEISRNGFVYDIIPFRKKDIKDVVVCGEPKTFCVYPVI